MEITFYPLTNAQKRIWYTEKFYPNTSISNLAGFGKLISEDGVHASLVESAIQEFVRRHESMRIKLRLDEDGEPVQYVSGYHPLSIEHTDIRQAGLSADELSKRGREEANRPLPLYDQDLFRFSLYTISENEVWFYANVHHIISDGISMTILGNTITDIYLELAGEMDEDQGESPSFIEHVLSEQEYVESKRFKKDRDFWNGQFETIPELVSLKRSRSDAGLDAKRFSQEIPHDLYGHIQTFCEDHKVSVLSLFQSALIAYLYRVTGRDDVVTGTFMGNRTNAKEKQMLGMFVSTVPVRTSVDGGQTFLEFVKGRMKDLMKILRHQKYPYNLLVNDLRESKSTLSKLFTVSLEYQVMQWQKKENVSFLTDPIFSGSGTNDISIHVKERWDTGKLTIDFDYRSDVFTEEEIASVSERLITLIEDAVLSPDRVIDELALISESEKERLLKRAGGNPVAYRKEMTIPELFQEKAEALGGKPAVVYEGRTLSYSTLHEQSGRIAGRLLQHGISADSPVAVLLGRSERVIAAIMGILKAGGAYVPIDPDFPAERIQYILEDSGAKAVLTEAGVKAPETGAELIDFDEAVHYETSAAGVKSESDRLAYIIYTSGTTGRPKGVMIEHRQVHHLVQALQQEIYQCGEQTLRMALLAPFHFDASVKQIFASLLLGQTLYIVPKTTVTNGSALLDYYRENRIEATDGTPAHLQMIAAAGDVSGIELRHLLIGGEGLSAAVADQLMKLFKEAGAAPRLTNVYGPTETCVDASVHPVLPNEGIGNQAAYVPIGKALGNARLYVLDKHKQLQPDGTVGELYIAGDGVGRGYLNMPDMTAEKFSLDPFAKSGTMYRTGDMVRWLPDGTMEYIGREDDQVKVRGYRIELGEIETVLRKAPGAAEAVVLARPDQQGNLDVCAYIVQEDATEFQPAEYREYVSKHLPDYMVPAYFTKAEEIPLTPSGKADRSKLFALDVQAVSSSVYTAPRNETEERLAAIWQEVLGMDKAGIYDHFFEAGGHSLKAMTLLTKIHKQMGVEIPLQYLFEHPTIAALADYAASREQGKAFSAIEPAVKQAHYPLSLAQQRTYIASQFEDAGVGYNMPAAAIVEGALDNEKLEHAFSVLIRRHEALRTSFRLEDSAPRQVIHEHVPFHIQIIEADGRPNEQVMKDFVRRFDLSEAPLFRIGLQKLDERRHMLMFDMHHLISDGVSIAIMLKELAAIYSGAQLPELRVQYKDYAVWQTERAEEGYQKEREYWKGVFAGELPVLQLLPDYPRPQVQSFEGDRVSAKLSKTLQDRLRKIAEKNGATLYMVLLSAYYTLLSKYSGQEDIIVGTPSAGRNHSDTEGLVGMFVNTLALRSSVKQDQSFTSLLAHVRQQVLNSFSHQDYPFEWLTEELNVPRDMSRHPIFDTMFSLQNAADGIPEIGDLTLSLHETNFNIAKFDLTMQARESADGMMLDLDYCTKLFKQSTADRMLAHYVHLLERAAAAPEAKIGDYDLLSEQEAMNQLQQFNPKRTAYPKDKTIVQIFEEQAEKTPNRTALQFEREELTYKELNERANRLARHILSVGGGGKTAAVLCERSTDMIVSIMAVLKAGSAYVPIDPEHPVQRIQHFFRDSGANVLLTQDSLKPIAEKAGFQGVIVLADDEASYDKESHNLTLPFDSKAIANLTYTSGTTGTPKGNIVTHANILRTVKDTNYLTVSEEDTVLGLSNYVFDAFMFDLFGSLLNGAKLVIVPKETVLDMSRLSHVIKRDNVSILMITTALFHLLIDVEPDCLSTLRKIMFGGERASVEHVKKALATVGKGKLLHMYGPSESTVFATYHPVDVIEEDTLSIPIGKPVSNTEVFILNADGRVQPAGVAGELCVSGEGLVQGYFNRPELTKEKFVPHPFKDGERMYKTGDLARWLPNGDIEFIGRIDHQVKIRGQRIELGEIEHQLQSHDRVQESVVLAVDQGAGDKLLCAYFVGLGEISSQELRKHTAKDLPAYMIPAVFIQMDELPLTGNGKIDRRALPLPDVTAANAVSYTAPRNEAEQKLADIWAEVLQTEQVGIHDQFFEIGGHSLAGMKLLALIHQAFGVQLTLKELFTSPTVAGLAQLIAVADQQAAESITPAAVQETYPVSSPQKRMFVLQQLEGAETSYNMPSVLRLKGKLDAEKLKAVMKQLTERHEAFRTTFEIKDGETVQRIWAEADLDVEYHETSEDEAERIIHDFIRPFRLDQLPLVRMGLVKIAEDDHLMLFDMHHIISDGASVGVLIDELSRLYGGETLEPLRIQYKDYAVWQREFIQSEQYRKQEEHWLQALDGELPVLTLPTDYSRPAVQTFEGDRLIFSLTEKQTSALRSLAKETDSTMYMVLLASYSAFLSKLSGQHDIIVGSPVAGRSHAELAQVIGVFVNTLAMRTYPEGGKAFTDYLNEVKQTALGAFDAQDYPLEDLLQKVEVQRDTSRNPLFDAVFSMQNANAEDLMMEGIELKHHPFDRKTAKFDLTLTADETSGGLTFVLEYNTALFKPETAETWKRYWLHLLDAVAENPTAKLSQLSLVNETEKQALLDAWKGKTLPVPRDKTVHRLFEETAARHAARPAVTYNGATWTYGELNAKANRLARILMDCGVSSDERVGILTKPSLEMAAGVLGVLKAGAAFVPIDPDYPAERISYILQDSGAKFLLTQETLSVPDSYTGDMILLDGGRSILSLPLDENDEANPQTETDADHLAYMIYTSGTTGQPKGVMVEHHALVNLCFWHHDAFGMTAEDKSAKYAGFGFDASIWEMFPTWTIGAGLHVMDEAIRLDITRLNSYFEENGVTITFLPTQLAEQFMELENTFLRMLLVGGDKLKRAVKKPYTIVNNYGPTENTVVATSGAIDPEEGSLSIGRAIANTRAYILGDGDQVQPEGIAGELCVAGRGLARGYLNREEETAKRFTADPFVPGERMYRTGDLVKWNALHGIEYIGRIDQQVKVRGYRIELSEIEIRLAQLADVHDAAVTAVKDKAGNTALCAYIAPAEANIETLKSALKETLPDYMVPAFWVAMDELPVTANGKVDKKALPEPDIEADSAAYKAPETEMESLLSDIWQEVLGLPQIGVSDNFFTLGGDSIKGIQMASRLNQHGFRLEMKDLFQHPTIEELVSYVERTEGKQADQGPVEGEAELTPIQRWFFEKDFTNKHHWNQSVMLHAAAGFDHVLVEKTLRVLTEHHDALRMVYREQKPYYRGLEDASVDLEVLELNGPAEDHEDRIEREADRLQSSIALETGNLLKAGLFQSKDGDHLLLAIHHLIVDGVSWRILLEDFAAVYSQLNQGNEPVLPPKTHSFAEFAEKLKEYADTKAFLKEVDYWKQLEEKEVCTQLPKDRQSSDQRMKYTKTIGFSLTAEQTELLTTKVHEAYHTEMNDILLTALGLALKEWTGRDTIGVHLEGHGREDILDGLNITRTVGWFTSMYPMVLEMKHADDLAYQLKQMKEDIRHIPNKGVGYGILRYVTAPEHKEGLSFSIEPDISFNYLGQFNEMSDSGLFTRSNMPSGQSLSPDTEKPNALDIVGFIENGQLTMTFAYHSLEFHEKTIQSFSDSFKAHLLKITDHCLAQDGPELTPSDLGDDDLTLDELDKLMEIL